MQASQVSMQLGDQSELGILNYTINPLPKPNERLPFYILTAKEKSATMYAERFNKF